MPGHPEPIAYVVDDDASVRLAIRRLLTSVGTRNEVFASAAEFMRRSVAPPAPYGCLVLDMRMPGPSGLDLQQALMKAQHDLAIIFVTAYADVPITVRAMRDGAIEVLTKPFDDQALLDALRRGFDLAARRFEEREHLAALRGRFDTLTAREREVMRLVATGMLNKQIGAALGTTEKTVKAHRAKVMAKMQARSLADLVRSADCLDRSRY
jgi:FixJ family two-component response regulator